MHEDPVLHASRQYGWWRLRNVDVGAGSLGSDLRVHSVHHNTSVYAAYRQHARVRAAPQPDQTPSGSPTPKRAACMRTPSFTQAGNMAGGGCGMWMLEPGLTDSYSRCRPRPVICRCRRLKAGVPLISIHCETRISGFNLGSSARRLLQLLFRRKQLGARSHR